MAKQLLVLRFYLIVSADDFARDDEDVDRGLRVDVAESHALVVLVNDRGGDLAVDDLLKDVVL